MLYIVFAKSDEEAVDIAGKPYLEYPDIVFKRWCENNDINTQQVFKEIIKEIDYADMPMKNVVRDLYTDDTHDVYHVSTGAKTLFLTTVDSTWLYPSQWFGENCYQTLFNLSKEHDIVVYDDSDMFSRNQVYGLELEGTFIDVRANRTVEVKDGSGFEYVLDNIVGM